ncbi:hypothetical protein LR48_Vigan01g077700 [Vigna angularis]|uniref:Uncharacterized protein n=1 Tax=Phaseolus angularis TaxID=3914 RepID=A0A0L9TLA3_PHAAN|nr:hypothetical protein LR48_Vigan01g077700 [Vigna angularis]
MIIPKDFPTVIKVGHYRRLLPFGIGQMCLIDFGLPVTVIKVVHYRRLLAFDIVQRIYRRTLAVARVRRCCRWRYASSSLLHYRWWVVELKATIVEGGYLTRGRRRGSVSRGVSLCDKVFHYRCRGY